MSDEEKTLSLRAKAACNSAGGCEDKQKCEIMGKCARVSRSVRGALIGRTGRVSESNLAERLGARVTPASGAANSKGDMRAPGWIIEAKSTTNDSMGLKLDWLAKISNEALGVGQSPALALTFTDERGNPRRCGSWVCIPEIEYRALLEMQSEVRNKND